MQVTYLLYPDVEPIDFAPLGVFSMATRVVPDLSCRLVAGSRAAVRLRNGPRVLPDLCFDEVTDVDVLLVPGGPGWSRAADDEPTLSFIRRWAPGSTVVSVCTGALILAAAGVLDGLVATTKCRVVPPEDSPLEKLAARPSVTTTRALIVDNGRVITGGGVTLGIDTALYLIGKRCGQAAADQVAGIMEYSAARSANAQRLPFVGGDMLARVRGERVEAES